MVILLSNGKNERNSKNMTKKTISKIKIKITKHNSNISNSEK